MLASNVLLDVMNEYTTVSEIQPILNSKVDVLNRVFCREPYSVRSGIFV